MVQVVPSLATQNQYSFYLSIKRCFFVTRSEKGRFLGCLAKSLLFCGGSVGFNDSLLEQRLFQGEAQPISTTFVFAVFRRSDFLKSQWRSGQPLWFLKRPRKKQSQPQYQTRKKSAGSMSARISSDVPLGLQNWLPSKINDTISRRSMFRPLQRWWAFWPESI